MKKPIKNLSWQRSYYYSSVIALGPIILLGLGTVGKVEFYEIILQRSKEFMTLKNIIAFEIGCTQGDAITRLAKDNYPEAFIQVKKDLAGKNRYLFIINE